MSSAVSPRRTRVKICGITNLQDAVDAMEAGADALGFNLYPGSKRFIDLKKEKDWIGALPPFVTKVAVVVNPTLAEAEELFRLPYIDVVQFHGNETAEFCGHFAAQGLPFIKAIAVKDRASLDGVERFGTRHILVDAYAPGEFGGTGRMIDPALMKAVSEQVGDGFRLILSGGLKPSNVRVAVEQFRPWAVDVASGVESSPGKKDVSLISEFVLAVTGAAL